MDEEIGLGMELGYLGKDKGVCWNGEFNVMMECEDDDFVVFLRNCCSFVRFL